LVGAIPGNLHEGGRSEILADYLFSRWGPVTPVRGRDDHGVDLYCALTEPVGKLAWVREYFSVQVKSTDDPWLFKNAEEVRWLVEYPTPLFLCAVNKEHLRVRIYHVFPRFHLWALGDRPACLELTPGEGHAGKCVQWTSSTKFDLSAPIIEASVKDLMDNGRLETLRNTFAHWVRFDRENCDLIRQGLLRFSMPDEYTTNEVPNRGIGQTSYGAPPPELLGRGLVRLAEALECIGGQRGNQGDLAFALEAAVLLDRIKKDNCRLFNDYPLLRERVPGQLGMVVHTRLNKALASIVKGRGDTPSNYLYAGLEAIERMWAEVPLARRFLEAESHGEESNERAPATEQ
jgi:hypothetical protein